MSIEDVTENFWRGVQIGKGAGFKTRWSNDLVGSTPTRATKYAYLLGMYLGDGHILKSPSWRVYRLRISIHPEQNVIEQLIKDCIIELFPNNKFSYYDRGSYKEVGVYSKDLLKWFPQHGPGRKHDRDIVLEKWQEEIIKKFPMAFIMGLLHSDGCYFINKVGKYEYPSFQFTNKSSDIMKLFTETLDFISMHYTINKRRDNTLDCLIRKRLEVNRLLEFWVNKNV